MNPLVKGIRELCDLNYILKYHWLWRYVTIITIVDFDGTLLSLTLLSLTLKVAIILIVFIMAFSISQLVPLSHVIPKCIVGSQGQMEVEHSRGLQCLQDDILSRQKSWRSYESFNIVSTRFDDYFQKAIAPRQLTPTYNVLRSVPTSLWLALVGRQAGSRGSVSYALSSVWSKGFVSISTLHLLSGGDSQAYWWHLHLRHPTTVSRSTHPYAPHTAPQPGLRRTSIPQPAVPRPRWGWG